MGLTKQAWRREHGGAAVARLTPSHRRHCFFQRCLLISRKLLACTVDMEANLQGLVNGLHTYLVVQIPKYFVAQACLL